MDSCQADVEAARGELRDLQEQLAAGRAALPSGTLDESKDEEAGVGTQRLVPRVSGVGRGSFHRGMHMLR